MTTVPILGIDMKLKDLFNLQEMAFSAGTFPEYADWQIDIMINRMKDAEVITQLRDNCWLCKMDDYMLIKKGEEVVCWMMVGDIKIAGTTYKHVDMFYVFPQYRKTGAGQWLFMAVRSHFNMPFVADHGISKGGEGMILSGKLKGYNHMFILNKKTGEKQPIDNLVVDDPDYCYLFETVEIRFGIPTPGFDKPPIFYELFESF